MNDTFKTRDQAIHSVLSGRRSPLGELYEKGLTLQKIEAQLKDELDSSIHDHFSLANIREDTIILLVKSSPWATRLRYVIPAILDAVNHRLGLTSIQTVRIKVEKTVDSPTSAKRKAPSLSLQSAKFLDETARSFSDPELSRCFKKLSRHTN